MPHIDRRPGVRPRPSLGHQLDRVARSSFPACLTALLMLLLAAPLGIGAQPELLLAAMVICVWSWSLIQPDYLPPLVVFLLGLLLDLVGYLPIGVGVLTLLLVHAVALRLRRMVSQQRFVAVWLTFVPVAAAAAVLMWLLVMLLTFRLTSPGPAMFQTALTISLYPVFAVPLAAARRSITSPERP